MSAEEIVTEALNSILADPRPSELVNRDRARVAVKALKDAGYAVVKLPESEGTDEDGQEFFGDNDIRVDHSGGPNSEHPRIYLDGRPSSPDRCRREAADLLAAAHAAERVS